MRWLAKAALQKALSALPAPESANYVFQRRVTHSLPVRQGRFHRRFRRALRHFHAFEEHGPPRPVGEAMFYEFGAGWDLAVPLSFWCLGVDHQILVDVRPNLRLELVNVTLARLRRLRPELEERAGRLLREPDVTTLASPGELEHRFGIVYLAPRDARATGLESHSVDFVSSTNTLEHVPEEEVRPILAECRRLLRPGGAISCRIDLHDHFADFDRSLSPYNFLRYSRRTWRLANSSLMHQNRLRYPDYLEAFADAGFELLVARPRRPRPAALEQLKTLHVAPELRARYSLEELAAPALAVVARPAGEGPVTRRSAGARRSPQEKPGAD